MRKRQSGVVLFVALILLLILSMIGVTVARMQTVEERMARNEHNRQLAEQAAEAALRNAEGLLSSPPTVGTFGQNTAGYYTLGAAGSLIPALDWNVAANVATYKGPALTKVPLNVQAPRLVTELLGYGALPGDDLSKAPATYRITVQGLNADGNPSVQLQSVYR